MIYLTLVSPQFLDSQRVADGLAALRQADWLAPVTLSQQSRLASDVGTLGVLQLQCPATSHAEPDALSRNQWLLTLAQEFSCDFAWQHQPPAPKRLAGFDMDGTTVAEESMVLLAHSLNKPGGDLVQRMTSLTDAAMGTGISFEESLLQRLALLAGSPFAAFMLASQRFTVNPGMATAVATMNGAGTLTALITGGYDPIKSAIANRLGFQQSFGNQLIFDDNDLFTGDCIRPILGKAAKAEILQKLAAQHGLAAKDCLFIGDGSNDLAALQWVMAGGKGLEQGLVQGAAAVQAGAAVDLGKAGSVQGAAGQDLDQGEGGGGLAVGWQPKPLLLPSLNAIIHHNAASLLAFQGLGRI